MIYPICTVRSYERSTQYVYACIFYFIIWLDVPHLTYKHSAQDCIGTIPHKNNETNDKFYWKVAFLMYTEMVNFRPQSWKTASKLKPHRGLGTRLPSS